MKHGVDPAPCLERNAGRRRRLGAAAGDLHDLGEVAAHVDEARRVGDVGVAEIEVGFVAVGGKRAGPAVCVQLVVAGLVTMIFRV